MTRYRIDTRADEAGLYYCDGSEVVEWEICGDTKGPEFLSVAAHDVELLRVTIDPDGSIDVFVHDETPLISPELSAERKAAEADHQAMAEQIADDRRREKADEPGDDQ